MGSVLGTGHFGSVYEGEAIGLIYPQSKTRVAIKTVNNALDLSQLQVESQQSVRLLMIIFFLLPCSCLSHAFCFQALLCEMKIMTNLDLHMNLVNLLGSCTAEIESRNLWLLIEYCPHGDLKTFLINHRQQFNNNIQGGLSTFI